MDPNHIGANDNSGQYLSRNCINVFCLYTTSVNIRTIMHITLKQTVVTSTAWPLVTSICQNNLHMHLITVTFINYTLCYTESIIFLKKPDDRVYSNFNDFKEQD